MSPSFLPTLAETDTGRYPPEQRTPEQLREAIETAVLHCIEYKAKAIEAAEKFIKDNETIY